MKPEKRKGFRGGLGAVPHTYLVGSGKGGVGKSTISANIAAALLLRGNRVGVLDADIYGPSIPLLFNAQEVPPTLDEKPFLPRQAFGIQLISLERLMPRKKGPGGNAMIRTLGRLIRQVNRGSLDFLIVDLPSGTGEIQNMIVEALNPEGALIVTTPRQIYLKDVQRCIRMFEKHRIPVTGLVENMVSWACEKCGHVDSFYTGLTDRWCEIETIAVLPMARSIWESSQMGVPLVFDARDSDLGRTFDRVAARLEYKHMETGQSLE